MYGSLAAIPIFLIWLYVGWMIVLCALEVSFVHQYKVHLRGLSPEPLHAGPGVDLLLGLNPGQRLVQATKQEIVHQAGIAKAYLVFLWMHVYIELARVHL